MMKKLLSIALLLMTAWSVQAQSLDGKWVTKFTEKELARYCQEAGFLPVEMRDRHVFALETITRAENAPPHHDPFDRMLIAQAKAGNMLLLTHDKSFRLYDEPLVCVV